MVSYVPEAKFSPLMHYYRLDRGGGKDLSQANCPRDKLERDVRARLPLIICDYSLL